MHFQYVTISRGGTSIIEKLKEFGIDADQYISWFSLRNFGKIKVPKQQPHAGTPLPNESGSVFGDEAAIKNPFDDNLSRLNTNTSTTSSTSYLEPPAPGSRRESAASSTHSVKADDDRYDYVSELLYLHDKLMIVDDRIVLMGSGKKAVILIHAKLLIIFVCCSQYQ
jgi:phosphatidylserine/phosphatidylglycerophosphate/cardiolipin synthase-like enzyme